MKLKENPFRIERRAGLDNPKDVEVDTTDKRSRYGPADLP